MQIYGYFTLTRVLNPNGISIGASIFAGLTSVTDRMSDRPRYSVGNNSLHSTAMRPKNICMYPSGKGPAYSGPIQ